MSTPHRAGVEIDGVTKRFLTPAGEVFTALEDVTFTVEPGQFCAVVGPTGWGPRMTQEPGVVLAGPVPAGALAALYARARLLAYVPLTEGFGLPPLEAMAACTPVVASPLPGTGDAAHVVDPLDVDAIADGLARVASDDGLRSRLVTAGLLRAGELTWAASARRHVELWRSMT